MPEEAEAEGRGPYVRKTPAELEELAQDLWSGRIFTSQQVEDMHMIPAVFMPMMLMGADHPAIQWMRDNKISLIYESMSKAGERSVNGYPIFMSIQMLDEHDATAVFDRAGEIADFMNSRKEKVDV